MRATLAGFKLVSLLVATPALAMNFGVLRPLQTGPVGDSPQFVDLGDYEAEAGLELSRTFGNYKRNGDSATKVSGSSLRSRLVGGGGMMATKAFGLTGYIDVTTSSDTDEEASRATPSSTLTSGYYQHEGAILGFYRFKPFVFGGGVGLVVIGSEDRSFVYDGGTYQSEISSAAMPTLRLFGGLSTDEFDATLGVRLFSMGEAVVEAQDPVGTKYEYDIVRRRPAEIHADARIKFEQASIATSLAYILTAQASEQVDEFSMLFRQDGASKSRDTGGNPRHKNTFKAALGGRWDPVKLFGLLGGLSYTSASYAKPEYATLEHENLGGTRIDVGSEVRLDRFRGVFIAGYTFASSASYTVGDDARSTQNLERTQRPPLQNGDRVKISQGSWSLLAGGGIVL